MSPRDVIAGILLVTPAPPGSRRGNRMTAERWADHLRAAGYGVEVAEDYTGQPCDLLLALHARRSAAAVARFREMRGEAPLVVVLTGTDLYRDIRSDADAQRSLELADRLVVLNPHGANDLPEHLRDRVRVVVQSAVARPGVPGEGFVACVLGHLREVKDPLRAAEASRLLPETSKLRVVQVGEALESEFEALARAEEQANSRYSWRGLLSHEDALQVLAGADVHVLTSRMEGGANAVCEAIACGVPTISTRITGSVGLLGEDYPGYFPVGDTEALAALLHRAETDPAFLADLRRRCAALADLVSPEAERSALVDVVSELLPLRARFLGSERDEDPAVQLAVDVRDGLTSRPRRLHCRFFYDAEGSRLFEQICELPEYYVTRAEDAILARRAAELPAALGSASGSGLTLFELGSGSAVKTRRIIRAFLEAGRRVTYVPVDISRSALEGSVRSLTAEFEALPVVGIAGEYDRGLGWLREHQGAQKLVMWLGSNIGNLDREAAAEFLGRVRTSLGSPDAMLLGVDMRKDRAVLEAAYDDAQGVTAAFNKNLLTRINRELGADFDLDAFAHRAEYHEAEGRISMHLVCRRSCEVRIDALDLTLSFADGEEIHTEDSYKYSPDEIDRLAAAGGFSVAQRWLDTEQRFTLALLVPS